MQSACLLTIGRCSSTPSPPLDEYERDRRTVFVQQLAARLRSKEFADFFKAAGKVRDARIVTDRITGRSKGYIASYHGEAEIPLIFNASVPVVWVMSSFMLKSLSKQPLP